jgi:hemolysin activation/secretion protein
VSLTNPTVSGVGAAGFTDLLVAGDLGAVYTLSRLDAARPWQFRIEPVVRGGHGGTGAFTSATATVSYHQEALGSSVLEVKSQLQEASRFTPVYELPSFGGVASVRGFRADDLLARRLWTVQPEIWTAVPMTGAPGSDWMQFISRNVRLALFCDAGGAWQTLTGPPGMKAGPGVGLRFQLKGATFRTDWAYGLGTAATGSGHGRLYFSVSRPIL